MRFATRKPPNTLMLASVAATSASVVTTQSSEPSCRSAPTRMMPEIAFVWAMSGVCRECVTFEMT